MREKFSFSSRYLVSRVPRFESAFPFMGTCLSISRALSINSVGTGRLIVVEFVNQLSSSTINGRNRSFILVINDLFFISMHVRFHRDQDKKAKLREAFHASGVIMILIFCRTFMLELFVKLGSPIYHYVAIYSLIRECLFSIWRPSKKRRESLTLIVDLFLLLDYICQNLFN